METQEQKLKDILRKHTFDAIVPDLITLDEQVEDNLYAFKEAFDDLLRMMRDARQNRSIARLERMGKIKIVIDRIVRATCSDEENYRFLYDTAAIAEFDLYSHTPATDGRAEYIAGNICKYFLSDLSSYTGAEVLFTSDPHHPLTAAEASTLRCAVGSLLASGQTLARYHFGAEAGLGHDFHVLLILYS